eukprot:3411100-Prymnesium_polylepis.1
MLHVLEEITKEVTDEAYHAALEDGQQAGLQAFEDCTANLCQQLQSDVSLIQQAVNTAKYKCTAYTACLASYAVETGCGDDSRCGTALVRS